MDTRILVTGANGFVGYHLVRELLARGAEVLATGRGPCRIETAGLSGFRYAPLDFTDPFAVYDLFEAYRPALVIHAGAMGRPDDCELHPWDCHVVNVEGTLHLLANAEDLGSFFVFVSTDLVFDGQYGMYREEDLPGPVNVYGRSKRDAEEAVQQYAGDWAIIRTVLVYGRPVPGKPQFLFTMKEKLENGETYRVVDDQFRTPTYVGDLVHGMISLLDRRATGIYHLAGSDLLTPFDMAWQAADMLKLDTRLLQRVNTADIGHAARRPARTGLVLEKARRDLDYRPVSFAEGLRKTFGNRNDRQAGG
ncbi:MAG TPA: SDR family oxidoreductase [Chitinophagaceae bacterium]|nr:SDR family oxidoreductase [Chitinophagaceae bacterium]